MSSNPSVPSSASSINNSKEQQTKDNDEDAGLIWIKLSRKQHADKEAQQHAQVANSQPWMPGHSPRSVKEKFDDIGIAAIIGSVVTVGALCYGLFGGLLKGNDKVSQNMMKLRVGAQGVTVALLLSSMAYATYRRKERFEFMEKVKPAGDSGEIDFTELEKRFAESQK